MEDKYLIKAKKCIMKYLLIFLIIFTIAPVYGGINVVASAATETAATPSLSVVKKTLYVGYKTYKLDVKNVTNESTYTYKSSNSKIAKVSKSGTITPVSKGNATITVTIKQNGKSYSLKVKITVKEPTISITTKSNILNEGDRFAFKATATGIKEKVKWSVSDETIATINSGNGILNAKSFGEITIYAKAGGKIAKCNVIIGKNRIGTFSTDVTCNIKETVWLTITDQLDGEYLSWEADNESLIKCKFGKLENNRIPLHITAKGEGTAAITIKSSKTTDCLQLNVKVSDKPFIRAEDIKELSAKEVYAKCGPATVEILATYSNGKSQGSGFFIDNGIVVTNYHVVDGASSIEVITHDKKKFKVDTILGYDKDIDLIIFSINSENEILTINPGDVSVGETVYALGSPLGLSGTLTAGIVSTRSRVLYNVDYIQITASISQGNSGGPLLNAYGEIIGINTFTYVDGQNLNFAVNVSEINKLNLNRPISVSEFYDKCMKDYYNSLIKGIIEEDAIVSRSREYCQEIPSNYIVNGTIAQPNLTDYYYIYMPYGGDLVSFVFSETLDDMYNTCLAIISSDQKLIFFGTEVEENFMQYISCYLPAGEYYILVYPIDEYNNIKDIPYSMFAMY